LRSVTEFNYRFQAGNLAEIFVGVEIDGGATRRMEFQKSLESAGYSVLDMSRNDTAKLHIRHMIGGRADFSATDELEERLYRFRFPERPGALVDFLTRMGEEWNITLFHYRNHGAAYGRVLTSLDFLQKKSPATRLSSAFSTRSLDYS